MNKIDKYLTLRKRENTKITKIKNERRDIKYNIREIEWAIREHYEQLYKSKFDNLN